MSRLCQSVAGGLSRTERDRYETPRDQHRSLANTRLWWAQNTMMMVEVLETRQSRGLAPSACRALIIKGRNPTYT